MQYCASRRHECIKICNHDTGGCAYQRFFRRSVVPKKQVGSEHYMAPEVHTGMDATFASDVFSFHVLEWEVSGLDRMQFARANPPVMTCRCGA